MATPVCPQSSLAWAGARICFIVGRHRFLNPHGLRAAACRPEDFRHSTSPTRSACPTRRISSFAPASGGSAAPLRRQARRGVSGRAKRTPAFPFGWRGGEAAAGALPGFPPFTSARDLMIVG
jgi:hypothetical protein